MRVTDERGVEVRCAMVSVLALREAAGEVRLLALRRGAGYLAGAWSYCAGHVEAGEAAWQAARRELAEETGLVPDALYATSFCEQFYSPAGDRVEVVPAFVARVPADAAVTLNGEHVAYRWVTPAEAAELFPFGSQRDLLEHVRREFIEREPAEFLLVDAGQDDDEPAQGGHEQEGDAQRRQVGQPTEEGWADEEAAIPDGRHPGNGDAPRDGGVGAGGGVDERDDDGESEPDGREPHQRQGR